MVKISQTAFRAIVVCLLILAVMSIFAPLTREAELWVKIISLTAIAVASLPLARCSEDEKKLSLLKVSAYLVLIFGSLVFVNMFIGKVDPAATPNENTVAVNAFLENTTLYWGASIGVFLSTLGSIVIRDGSKGGLLMGAGIVAVAIELLLCYLPVFIEKRSLALQLAGAAYLILALGYWRAAVLESYGEL